MELTPRTKQGSLLVELAEQLAEQLADTVGEHDRRGTYIREHLTALVDSGWLSAPVPEELGGRGVRSTHDLFVAASRLARGDAAATIGASMHVTVVANLVRQYVAADDDGRAGLGMVLDQLVAGRVVIAAAISEPGQDLTRPSTIAVAVDDHWRIDGTKIFCTMSPAADVFLASATVDAPRGERYAYVAIPATAPGVVVHDDWDALGMRTSGSNSVSFTDVRVDGSAFMGGFPSGSAVGYAARNLASGGFHAAASLGIAESAHAHAIAGLRARGRVDGSSRSLVADNEVDLHSARSALSRAGDVVDAHDEEYQGRRAADGHVLAVFGEVQTAKVVVGAAAMRVVDRSLLLTGGAGYRAGTPLARAVGDVRALMFMNPLNTTRAATFLADLALGATPTLA
ncbi:MAG TPA: acyl-CoA dehydrogenase family protein [Ilumatobacteraceae bacterium]|nr:acyl-CoA dehydrogenase family protein [Ilumatobacteraceae bacterium]